MAKIDMGDLSTLRQALTQALKSLEQGDGAWPNEKVSARLTEAVRAIDSAHTTSSTRVCGCLNL